MEMCVRVVVGVSSEMVATHNQPINQSTNQPIKQSNNQPINQSNNQTINQSNNHQCVRSVLGVSIRHAMG